MAGSDGEGGIGGITPPGASSAARRRQQQRQQVQRQQLRRRRFLVLSDQLSAPVEQTETEVHTLRKDFLTTAVSAPGGSAEVQTVFDADGGMQFYVPAATDSTPGAVQLAADGGTTASTAVQASDSRLLGPRETAYEWFDDLDWNAVGSPWAGSNTGTSAGIGAQATDHVNSTEKALGEINLTVGTTSTGRASVYRSHAAILLGSCGALEWETRFTVGAASTATDEFVVVIGLGDQFTASAEPTHGAYFAYRRAVDGDFWVCVTRDNSSETKTVTSVVPADYSTLHRFQIAINEAGTSVVFSIDGTVVATHTTNIPTAAGRRVGMGLKVYKTAGTTQRWIYADWVRFKATRSSAR